MIVTSPPSLQSPHRSDPSAQGFSASQRFFRSSKSFSHKISLSEQIWFPRKNNSWRFWQYWKSESVWIAFRLKWITLVSVLHPVSLTWERSSPHSVISSQRTRRLGLSPSSWASSHCRGRTPGSEPWSSPRSTWPSWWCGLWGSSGSNEDYLVLVWRWPVLCSPPTLNWVQHWDHHRGAV